MRIAIIGAGLMGLALADRLAGEGRAITVVEREPRLGGLTTWHDYGGFTWDRFYHVILPSDTHLLRLIRSIGLESSLRWERTLTGFFVDRQFYSMSSSMEFLRFPPVSLFGKARLAFTILYCARLQDWKALETQPVGPWLRRMSGTEVYEKIWQPLLLAKLGQTHERVSAVFIWTYIKRMFSARDASTQKERLGYVSGGYRTVFDRLAERVQARGGQFCLGTGVETIRPAPNGGLIVAAGGREEVYDRVVFTGPADILERVADPALAQVRRSGSAVVEYLGVVCVVIVSRKPLVPYYVVNIADDRVPFTGVIGMGNLVAQDQTAGLHLTYLPKYVLAGDAWLARSDEEVREAFLAGLRLMLPQVDQCEIVSIHVNRATRVQPLQVLNYSAIAADVTTRHDGLFVLNTSRFVASTLNNNEVAHAVDEFVGQHGSQFELQAEHPATVPTTLTAAVAAS